MGGGHISLPANIGQRHPGLTKKFPPPSRAGARRTPSCRPGPDRRSWRPGGAKGARKRGAFE